MGEVYRALDTRLSREVALKILPAALADDPNRQARFEQEAKAAAALNHPNIVGVFDFGANDGAAYIVSELVRGETLTAIIERGPAPIKKLLDIASQVADGMAAAHAARIVHRELKPANIMLAEDGRAKILDFGLARQAPASAASSPDATATMHLTSAGMIMGTANYMSPEQARGQECDYRSDQFSFGLILYEMASGKRAFERPETVQTMSAILTDDPPPLDARLPAPLRWSIDRCLAKEPRDRYESTRDLFHELRYLRDHLAETTSAGTGPVTPVTAPKRRRWRLPVAFASGALCAAAAALAFFATRPHVADQSSYRFTPLSFEAGGQCCAFWSPDGKAVAYTASHAPKDHFQIYLRYLDSPAPVQLTHTPENAAAEGWAADGKHVLFSRPGVSPPGIWSISTVGGDPEFLFPFPTHVKAGALSPDGKTYAALREGPDGKIGVWYSSPPGGTPREYRPDPFATPEVFNTPQVAFSPDSRQLLLYAARNKTGEEAWLLPFPPDSAHPPRQVLPKIHPQSGTPEIAWAPDNRHVVLSTSLGLDAQQLWMADTRSNDYYAITSGTRGHGDPAVSPDGKRLVFADVFQNTAIVSVDLATAALRPVLSTDRLQLMPAWAAHGPVMAYVTDRNGPQELWLMTTAGERPLPTGGSADRWLVGPAPRTARG